MSGCFRKAMALVKKKIFKKTGSIDISINNNIIKKKQNELSFNNTF